MKILILDDDQTRHDGFKKNLIGFDLEHTYTSKECIEKLKNNTYNMVLLDHDLGGQVFVDSGENTGWEVSEWLSKNPDKKPKHIIVHSWNPVGANNMKNVLITALCIPFGKNLFDYINIRR
jgi:CheY-like chemotaxis protein